MMETAMQHSALLAQDKGRTTMFDASAFANDQSVLRRQFDQIAWDETSGLSAARLAEKAAGLARELADQPRSLIKARIFALILREAQIKIEPKDVFASLLRHDNLLIHLRKEWIQAFIQEHLPERRAMERQAWETGAFRAEYDFGHTAPDWQDVLRLGVPGLLDRVRTARHEKMLAGHLTDEQAVFYEAATIVYTAFGDFLLRLAQAAAAAAQTYPEDTERMLLLAVCLKNLAVRPPGSLYEALQLSIVFHMLQEEVEGERLRSLGGLDRLCRQFYEQDLGTDRITRARAVILFKYYFTRFYALTGDRLFGQPLFLGGMDQAGHCVVSSLTWLILQAADELALPNPKIHIRVTPDTPPDFLAACCDMIRRGNSSLVFVNDTVAIEALRRTGVTLEEARNYILIGCYEPAASGREVPCTGGASLNLAKAVELVLRRGIDPVSGKKIGRDPGPLAGIETFADFLAAVKQQISEHLDLIVETVAIYERDYLLMNPAPLFSATLAECVISGRDAYAGGAKYNNSSVNFGGLGSAVDSLSAVKKWVYDQGLLTLEQLAEHLDRNWSDAEPLRRQILLDPDKWGNNRHEPDQIAQDLTQFIAGQLNSRPNGRNGVYKAGLFSIDRNFYFGARMGALPDGRLAGQPLAKNLSAVTAMDRAGVTALIDSVTKIDHSQFPNGSVLDILLHPTSVKGADGLAAMQALITTYFNKGGFAIHANVLDAAALRAAQLDPAAYATLQVRVCGWNVYFVNLSPEEQDEFIRQAEHADEGIYV
jgi:formate C-acetyltransferase